MKIEFDPAKDALNRKRHGLPLAFAAELDWGAAQTWVDQRFLYDEVRMTAVVPHGLAFYNVAFVDRGDTMRIISLRRASMKEVRNYGKAYY